MRSQHGLRHGGLELRMETVDPNVLIRLSERMARAAEKVWEVSLDYDKQRSDADDDMQDGLQRDVD